MNRDMGARTNRPHTCDDRCRPHKCKPLGALVNTMDPKLVAAAFGMTPEATRIYLAGAVIDM